MQIQIRRFVGRRTQAKAAKIKHWRSLFPSQCLDPSSLKVRNSPCQLCRRMQTSFGGEIILVDPLILSPIQCPLPRPQTQCRDRQSRFQTVRERPRRTEPLPRATDSQGQLPNPCTRNISEAQAGVEKLFDSKSMDATYSCPRLVAFLSVYSSP